MKSLLVLATVLVSSQAMSAEVLLKFTKGSGFGPFPMSTTVEVKDNGEITRTSKFQNKTEKSVTGKLSASTVQVIKDRIEMIADDAKLVDLDAKKPRCMDAPSSRTSVNKGGKEIQIAGVSNCHRLAVEGSPAEALANVVEAFVYISK